MAFPAQLSSRSLLSRIPRGRRPVGHRVAAQRARTCARLRRQIQRAWTPAMWSGLRASAEGQTRCALPAGSMSVNKARAAACFTRTGACARTGADALTVQDDALGKDAILAAQQLERGGDVRQRRSRPRPPRAAACALPGAREAPNPESLLKNAGNGCQSPWPRDSPFGSSSTCVSARVLPRSPAGHCTPPAAARAPTINSGKGTRGGGRESSHAAARAHRSRCSRTRAH